MFKKLKKGFTIVELVIVIAVIAILAAVLIPTFSNVIKKANRSSDTQLIRNLNEAVAIELADSKTSKTQYDTMYDAVQACVSEGYSVDRIVAKSDYNIAWESTSGHFVLLDMTANKVMYPVSASSNEEYSVAGKEYEYFVVTKADKFSDTKNAGYSIYAYGDGWETVKTSTGFDVGSVTTITSIDYTNNSARNTIIRTKGNMCELTIYAPNDHVEHYGYANTVNVVAVNSTNSYHEYGTTSELVVAQGKVVVEETGVVFALKQDDFKKTSDGSYISNTEYNALSSKPTIEESGSITKDTTPVVSNNGGNVMASSVNTVSASTTFEINNLSQLKAFRDATNSGKTFAGLTINLNCDINLQEAWTPISNYYRKDKNDNTEKVSYGDFDLTSVAFQGTFNGNNHTISGLTNVGLLASQYNTGYNSSTPSGKTEAVYGFFGTVYNATIKNIKFSNVKITSDGFGSLLGDSIGTCVGFAKGNTTIDTIEVLSGSSITAYDSVGGIVGLARKGAVSINNCENHAAVNATRRAAGICGQYGTDIESSAKILNCKNYGNISINYKNDTTPTDNYAYYTAAGIVVLNNTESSQVSGCSNSGTITTTMTSDMTQDSNINTADIAISQNNNKK